MQYNTPTSHLVAPIDTATPCVYTKFDGQHPAQDHPWPSLLLSRRVPPCERSPPPDRPGLPGLPRHPPPTPPAAGRALPGTPHPFRWYRCPIRSRPTAPLGRTHRSVRSQTPPGPFLRPIHAGGRHPSLPGAHQQVADARLASLHPPAALDGLGPAAVLRATFLGQHGFARRELHRRHQPSLGPAADGHLSSGCAQLDLRLHQLRYLHRYRNPQPTPATRSRQKQTHRPTHRRARPAGECRFSCSPVVEGVPGQSTRPHHLCRSLARTDLALSSLSPGLSVHYLDL